MSSFEELAKRLSAAPTPEERVRAAEALSRLDDPRVAPTLARALADPDERVRARVEELLSGFCRRDRAEGLLALLEEAERVAAALSEEVRRLRGGVPEPPPPPRLEPILPPEGYEGECALVRLTHAAMDIKRVSRMVARELGRLVFEVSREISATKGFIARGVAAEAARGLVVRLAELGVPAAAVPMDQVPEPIPPERLRNPRFTPQGLEGDLLPSGRAEVAWGDVALAVAGRIELDVHPGGLCEDWSPFTQPLKPRTGERRPQFEHVVEVFTRSPARRLRLLTHALDFKELQRRPSNFARVARLGRELARRVARERLCAGLWLLADRDEDGWEHLTFTSPVGYEDYVVWQRLLQELGVPLPR